MKNVSKYLVGYGVLCLFLFACKKNKVVLFNGGYVSSEEIIKKAGPELFRLKQQEYEVTSKISRKIAMEKIIELEAKKKKVSKERLIKTYVDKNFQPPKEQMLQEFYKYNKQVLNKSFTAAYDEIYAQAVGYIKGNLKNKYYQELSNNYNLKITLDAPVPPSIVIEVKKEPSLGNLNAKVVIVEYSDFECPYCKKMQLDAQRIRLEYKDKIRWVFKDFPLSFHQKARKAHIAANCADQQKKYKQYQEKIFTEGFNLSEPNLIKLASDINLNQLQFQTCLADKNGDLSKEIDEDIEVGSANGVGGTPTLFVNGKISPKFISYSAMKKILDKELTLAGVN